MFGKVGGPFFGTQCFLLFSVVSRWNADNACTSAASSGFYFHLSEV